MNETAYLEKEPLGVCGKCQKDACVKVKVLGSMLFLHRCSEHWQVNPKIVEETTIYV